MFTHLTDAQFNTIGLVLIAVIGIVPATLAAIWSRTAKTNSAEAVENSANAATASAAAQESAAVAAWEVRTNGGMSDPNPNLNDHVKYQTEMLENLHARINGVEVLLANHLEHSAVMDRALARVYLTVKPEEVLGDESKPD